MSTNQSFENQKSVYDIYYGEKQNKYNNQPSTNLKQIRSENIIQDQRQKQNKSQQKYNQDLNVIQKPKVEFFSPRYSSIYDKPEQNRKIQKKHKMSLLSQLQPLQQNIDQRNDNKIKNKESIQIYDLNQKFSDYIINIENNIQ
ncbi:hypothetical protein PPERSA_06159 [Pseudocohnilembus persalinus]|uniref:Uncharacterized protein n=1 Tax=Pseudocohnilembus persalinus TaxID=266149 RepID=A0A0V0QE90_PSEPJ|nr:hypothetical protein PPERSA_06159 [Pseudocohnilembus persalinus]|eukprot:KRX00516.1 hypothetical protein PPERSA_06159 [Pseudocohnilembus persalinus]